MRHELESYGAGLENKAELVALNKVDALSPELRTERMAALVGASGGPVLELSGASGEGVQAVLHRLYAMVQESRGEAEASSASREYVP